MPDLNLYDTHTLDRVVRSLFDETTTFMLDAFFPNVQAEGDERIYFDVERDFNRSLIPFVSPYKAGKVMSEEGFDTKSFKPAYVKDKRVHHWDKPLQRQIGENFGGTMSPEQRAAANLRRDLERQVKSLKRRETVMAAEIMLTGKLTITGDGYPLASLDFQRNPAHTVALTGAAAWGNAGVNPLDNCEQWVQTVQDNSGAVVQVFNMTSDAWRLFRNSPVIEKYLEYRRGTSNTLNVDPMVDRTGTMSRRYRGSIGDFDFYTYNDKYMDDSGAMVSLLPDNTVILGGAEMMGTRCYGRIMDHKASWKNQEYFVKSWEEEDPSVRWLLLQAAPLLVPFRPDASFAAQVA